MLEVAAVAFVLSTQAKVVQAAPVVAAVVVGQLKALRVLGTQAAAAAEKVLVMPLHSIHRLVALA